jgi:hypothetical protein
LTREPKTYTGEKATSSTNGAGKLVISRPLSLTLQKINSKWIKDLNIRPETLKLILKKIEKTIGDIGIGNCFLNMIPIVQETGYPCVED